MTSTNDRLEHIEHRLDGVAEDVRVLKNDVTTLKNDVTTLKTDVTALKTDVTALKSDVAIVKDDVGKLKGDVHRLHVLFEGHETKIKTIAEVQSHHGLVLEEIRKSIAPLGEQRMMLLDIHDFVRRVTGEHEARLAALEKHTGLIRP